MPEATDWLRPLLVPAAHSLPSAGPYLEHLDRAAADPTLIRLATNESTEPPSPRVREALVRAYEHAHLYAAATPPLRHALAERLGVDAREVLLGAGSTELIDATLRTFVRADDEVVLPVPTWPVFRRRLDALEAHVVEVPLTEDEHAFAFDVDAVLAAVTPRAKLVVLCTPNNPTGNAIGLADARRLADAGPLLLVDGAYADFDAENDLTPLLRESERVVLTRTFSKAYSLAGLRVGYAVGARDVLDHVERLLVPGSSVSSASLAAAAAALEDEEHRARLVERTRTERARVTAGLRERGFRAFDSRANFVAVDAPPALAATLLERGILVRVLGERLVRITVGRPAENDALLAALPKP